MSFIVWYKDIVAFVAAIDALNVVKIAVDATAFAIDETNETDPRISPVDAPSFPAVPILRISPGFQGKKLILFDNDITDNVNYCGIVVSQDDVDLLSLKSMTAD